MKLRLAALAAGLALVAAAPVWAGTIKVNFADCSKITHNDRSLVTLQRNVLADNDHDFHSQFVKHIGWEFRGRHRDSDSGSGWAASDPSTSDLGLGSTKSQGGYSQCASDPPASSAAPEPGSFSFFVLALVGVGLVARKRFRSLRAPTGA